MKRNERGFTLVELLAVIVILGLLMAIAIPLRVVINLKADVKATGTGTIDNPYVVQIN